MFCQVVKIPVSTVSVKIPKICENRLLGVVLLLALFGENEIKDIWHICGILEEC